MTGNGNGLEAINIFDNKRLYHKNKMNSVITVEMKEITFNVLWKCTTVQEFGKDFEQQMKKKIQKKTMYERQTQTQIFEKILYFCMY